MRALITLVVVGLVSACFSGNGLLAQGIPSELMAEAKEKYELAFKSASGKLPPSESTQSALELYKKKLAAYATEIGQRDGLEALRRDMLKQSVAHHDGLGFLRTLTEPKLLADHEIELDQTDISNFVKLDALSQQLDGVKIIDKVNTLTGLEENCEIVFPEGSFEFDESALTHHLRTSGKAFPKGVAFVGRGKEETTLKISNASFGTANVDRLTFRDMTINCDNDGMFDKRSGNLILRMSNVRVIRFDAGHAGCTLFYVRDGLIVHASDTDFVGGLGRSPGSGSVFGRSDVLLGHFERCTFQGIKYDLFRSVLGHSNRLWMNNCQFDQNFRANENVQFTNCTFNSQSDPTKHAKEEKPE